MKKEKIIKKLKKTYIKMLYSFANGLITRGYELEDKAILLELKLKNKRDLIDDIDEGLDALSKMHRKTMQGKEKDSESND